MWDDNTDQGQNRLLGEGGFQWEFCTEIRYVSEKIGTSWDTWQSPQNQKQRSG
jgi:hypothetical protein